MDLDKVLTAIAGAFVLLPTAVPAMVPEAASDPRVLVVLAMFSIIGAAILKQSPPAVQNGTKLSDEDVQRIASEMERQRRERVNLVRTAGKVRRD